MSNGQNRSDAARVVARIINLRTAAIRLAHENPGPVRDALLPILKTASMTRTAGEVRHVKDRAGDEKNFAWAERGPTERDMNVTFEFDANKLKPLAKCLRATLMALGHSQSAYHDFTKLKSAVISPDGNLGGKGYIQRITEMRRSYMNVSEALSALSDTIYDEINAAHWNPQATEEDPRERTDVAEIMDDVDEIREDPEGFAEEIEEDMEGHGKTAGALRYEGDTPLDKTYAMTDLLHEIGRDLHRRGSTGSSRSAEFKAVQTALRKLETFVDREISLPGKDRLRQLDKTAWTGADPDLDAKGREKQVQQILKALTLLSHHKIKPKVHTDVGDGWVHIEINASPSMAAAYIENHLDEQLGSRIPFSVEAGGTKVYISLSGEDARNRGRRANARRVANDHLGKAQGRGASVSSVKRSR